MKRILYLAMTLALGTVSCSQDLGQNPPFDYPQNEPPKEIPMPADCIFRMSFEDNLDIDSSLGIEARMKGGSAIFTDGQRGLCYQGADKKALILNLEDDATAKIKEIGSFTLTLWIKHDGSNKNACSLFAISHPTLEVGNAALFLNNMEAEGETFFFKGYFNGTSEKWFDRGDESKVTSGIKGKWAQMGMSYDAATSTATLYYNGVKKTSAVFEDFGALSFKEVNGIVLGAFPSMVGLSSAATGWPASGTYYTGLIDELYLYGKALSDTEMVKQYQDQM